MILIFRILKELYIVLFLHQTTTDGDIYQEWEGLYIVLFLHQTTTRSHQESYHYCCISYYSYIKPQRIRCHAAVCPVVYRTIPTSNHNLWGRGRFYRHVVYRTIPTSNHNNTINSDSSTSVVYRTIPTSNHNLVNIATSIFLVVYRTIPTSNHNAL